MKIDLIVYDFDGVMTNNQVLIMQDGKEAVFCNRDDGWAIRKIKEMGIVQLILSSEKNPIVISRALKLSIQCISGCLNKEKRLRQFCRDENLLLVRTIYIGNSLNDLKIMKIVGYSIAPIDAHPDIIKVAGYVTKRKGGEGVILEVLERIVK
ncbi:MAG: HAD hydrolase family protein [Nitrosopumilus sp.]